MRGFFRPRLLSVTFLLADDHHHRLALTKSQPAAHWQSDHRPTFFIGAGTVAGNLLAPCQ